MIVDVLGSQGRLGAPRPAPLAYTFLARPWPSWVPGAPGGGGAGAQRGSPAATPSTWLRRGSLPPSVGCARPSPPPPCPLAATEPRTSRSSSWPGGRRAEFTPPSVLMARRTRAASSPRPGIAGAPRPSGPACRAAHRPAAGTGGGGASPAGLARGRGGLLVSSLRAGEGGGRAALNRRKLFSGAPGAGRALSRSRGFPES